LFFPWIPLGFRIGAGYIFCDQGYQMNMQPSCVEAGFHIRIPPTVDPELLVNRIFDEWAPRCRNITYKVRCLELLIC
ncbi:hypothetical protein MKW92_005098, partial [Papaver armeniacum]